MGQPQRALLEAQPYPSAHPCPRELFHNYLQIFCTDRLVDDFHPLVVGAITALYMGFADAQSCALDKLLQFGLGEHSCVGRIAQAFERIVELGFALVF